MPCTKIPARRPSAVARRAFQLRVRLPMQFGTGSGSGDLSVKPQVDLPHEAGLISSKPRTDYPLLIINPQPCIRFLSEHAVRIKLVRSQGQSEKIALSRPVRQYVNYGHTSLSR